MLSLVLMLFGVGLLTIYSITLTASAGFNNPNNWGAEDYVFQQAALGGAGIILMFGVVFVPHSLLRKLGPAAIAVTLLLLIATDLFGVTGNGTDSLAQRWLVIGGRTVQPGEFARLGLIYSVAWLIYWLTARKTYALKWTKKYLAFMRSPNVPFSRKRKYYFGSYWTVCAFVAAVALLFVRQPDLGSAITVFGVGATMILTSGIPKRHVYTIVGGGIAFAGFGLLFAERFLHIYQMDRFAVWQDPFNHSHGLQNVLGFRSIALGGLFGTGLGESVQRFGFAIEAHTDFIITIIAEELGFVAVLGVMAAYFAIGVRCFATALKGKDLFSSLFCVGTGALFLIQSLINLGGASGFIPLTGITLPLLSFGGTSAIAIFLMVGVYLNARIEIMKDNLPMQATKKKIVSKKVIPFLKAS